MQSLRWLVSAEQASLPSPINHLYLHRETAAVCTQPLSGQFSAASNFPHAVLDPSIVITGCSHCTVTRYHEPGFLPVQIPYHHEARCLGSLPSIKARYQRCSSVNNIQQTNWILIFFLLTFLSSGHRYLHIVSMNNFTVHKSKRQSQTMINNCIITKTLEVIWWIFFFFTIFHFFYTNDKKKFFFSGFNFFISHSTVTPLFSLFLLLQNAEGLRERMKNGTNVQSYFYCLFLSKACSQLFVG